MAVTDTFFAGDPVTFRTSGSLGHSEERYGTVISRTDHAKGTYYTIKEDGEPTEKVVKARPALMAHR